MKELTIFGNVCLDIIKFIDHYPPPKGSYTEIRKKCTLLGGEAANTLICICQLLKDIVEEKENRQRFENIIDNGSEDTQYEDIMIRFNTVPFSDDQIGRKTLQLLSERLGSEEQYKKYLQLRIPPLVSNEVLSSAACDIFLTPDSERTMFGFGFERVNEYIGSVSEQMLNLIEWSKDSWITFDYNTSTISNTIIEHAVQKGVNLYVMDHVLPDTFVAPASNEHGSAFFFQTSTDYLGKKNNIEITLGTVRELVARHPTMFFIITDGANGLAAGGCFRNSIGAPNYIQPFWRYAPKLIEPVVDSIGAGDAFRSGMLFALLQGYPIQKCLDFACVSGALNTRYIGGNFRVPQKNEIIDYINQITHR